MKFNISRCGDIRIFLDDCVKFGTVEELKYEIYSELMSEEILIERDSYYLLHNGKILSDNNIPSLDSTQDAQTTTITLVPRVLGGKGGFGSMLRAIGAQIEKTTNRDACRDLSGRRLRDINEEQRLKKWFAKQAERESERKEAKKRKLEKLKQVADGPGLPKIDDQEFLQKKEDIEESVYEAVDAGFVPESSQSSDALSSDSNSSESFEGKEGKESSESEKTSSQGTSASGSQSSSGTTSSSQGSEKPVKKSLIFDEDFVSGSDSDSDEDEIPSKMAKVSN